MIKASAPTKLLGNLLLTAAFILGLALVAEGSGTNVTYSLESETGYAYRTKWGFTHQDTNTCPDKVWYYRHLDYSESQTSSWNTRSGTNGYSAESHSLMASSTVIVTNIQVYPPSYFTHFSGNEYYDSVYVSGTNTSRSSNSAHTISTPDAPYPGSIPLDNVSPACWYTSIEEPCYGENWTNTEVFVDSDGTTITTNSTGFYNNLLGFYWGQQGNTNFTEGGVTVSYSYSNSVSPAFLGEWFTQLEEDPDEQYSWTNQGEFHRSFTLSDEYTTEQLLDPSGIAYSGSWSSGGSNAYSAIDTDESSASMQKMRIRFWACAPEGTNFPITYAVHHQGANSSNDWTEVVTFTATGTGATNTYPASPIEFAPPYDSVTNGSCARVVGATEWVTLQGTTFADTNDVTLEDEKGNPCSPPAANDGPEGGGAPCDPALAGGGEGSAGMAVWRVSEPYINLWLHDTPLHYRLASGEWMPLQLSYKERSAARSSVVAGFGPGWSCDWIGWLEAQSSGFTSGTVVSVLAGGGQTGFDLDTGAPNYQSGRRATPEGNSKVTIRSSRGSGNVYGNEFVDGVDNTYKIFLTNRVDRYGRVTTYNWVTTTINYTDYARLSSVVDRDGRESTLEYDDPTYPQLVTKVTDPYGRSAEFEYDGYGRLSKITDTEGMESSFQYDANGVITNLHTPYGDTGFEHFEGTIAGSVLNRAIRITEPAGTKQLYAYRDNGLIGSESAGGVFASPDGQSSQRNSYHWNRLQYEAISAQGLANVLDMPVADYHKASLKHWLYADMVNEQLSDTPSATAGPMIDGERTGQTAFWYQGQANPFEIGTIKRVTRIVQNGTNYSPGTTMRIDISRNSWGRPTRLTYWLDGQPITYTNIFDSDGRRLLEVWGPNGEQVRGYGYHPVITNLLTSVTNALGEVIRYTHDTSTMQVTSVSLPSGLVTTNLYYSSGDSEGFLQQQIDIGFRTNSFTYQDGNLDTKTDALGLTTSRTWDYLGRLTSVSYPDATYTSNRWDKLDLVGRRDREGHWTYYDYDANRQLRYVTNANGHVTQYDYCGCGSPSEIIRWNGTNSIVTTYTYDLAGRLTNALYADNYSVIYTYDGLDRIVAALDSGGHEVDLGYNDYRQLTTVEVGGTGNTWLARHFDEYGRVTSSTNRNGVVQTNAYDWLDRLTVRHVQGAGMETFAYNARGLTHYNDELGKNTWFGHDAAGRLLHQTNANNEVLSFTYNPADELLTLTDGKHQVTTWRYDTEGRVTNKLDQAGTEIFRYGYDGNARLTHRWTAAKGDTYYGYDAVGNLTSVDYPGTLMDVALGYDALERLTTVADAMGTTTFGYTDAGQLQSEDGPWNDDTVSYTYQSRQRSGLNLLQPGASAWTESYGYDSQWRLTNVTSQAGSFGYQYRSAASDLRTGLTLPGGAYITNSYDSVARLLSTTLKNAQNAVLNSHAYVLNDGHQRTKQTFTDGNYVNYTYDNIGQLKTAEGWESDGSTERLNEQFGYDYDAAWNLNHRTNNALVQTFGVNNRNELTTATHSGTLTVAGRTTSVATNVTVNGLSAEIYDDHTFARAGFTVTNGLNSFTAVARDDYGRADTNSVSVTLPPSVSFQYDANGNLTNDGKRVFGYDYENQLTSVYVEDAWKSEFAYDAFGRRRVRTEYRWSGSAWTPTNEVHYVYDGMLVIQERDGSNVPKVSYTRGTDLSGTLQRAGGIGGLLARSDHTSSSSQLATAFYHADGNGNVTALVNASGLVVARYHYDPYGNTLSASGPLAHANLYRFSSKEWHANAGLYYYGYRYYEPNLQRWLSRDPIGEVDNVNVYSFAASDPLNGQDSWGLFVGGILIDCNYNGIVHLGVHFGYYVGYDPLTEEMRHAIGFGPDVGAGVFPNASAALSGVFYPTMQDPICVEGLGAFCGGGGGPGATGNGEVLLSLSDDKVYFGGKLGGGLGVGWPVDIHTGFSHDTIIPLPQPECHDVPPGFGGFW